MKIIPDKDCKKCFGWGKVSGGCVPLPFGPGWCSLPDEFCICVIDQSEGESEEIEIELHPEIVERDRRMNAMMDQHLE